MQKQHVDSEARFRAGTGRGFRSDKVTLVSVGPSQGGTSKNSRTEGDVDA